MKARPRNAENRIAEILSNFFVSLGYGKVERVPVIGRTGPDLQINSFGLVVDVKSRLEIPLSFVDLDGCYQAGNLLAFPVSETERIFEEPKPLKKSLIVQGYYDHMKEWTDREYPSGISAIVLHRPKLPYGKSTLILSITQKEDFVSRWKTQSQHSPLATMQSFLAR